MTFDDARAKSRGFVVSARTILELGAELISSDPIALYELIKNAYDAGSKRATIRITTVFKYSHLRNTLRRVDEATARVARGEAVAEPEISRLVAEIANGLDASAPEELRQKFISRLDQGSLERLGASLQAAFDLLNQIEVVDTGDGMSLTDLQEAFLTIGTRSRLRAPAGQRQFVGGNRCRCRGSNSDPSPKWS